MGALFKGVCYPDAVAARQEACSASAATWGSGTSAITTECATSNFTLPTFEVCKRIDGGLCSILTYEPFFPDCEYAGGTDMALEWLYLVLPILATLWGVKKLAEMFSTNPKDDA